MPIPTSHPETTTVSILDARGTNVHSDFGQPISDRLPNEMELCPMTKMSTNTRELVVEAATKIVNMVV